MNDWFSWNGVKCTEYGIHVMEQPAITFAAERSSFVDIPGRSGSLTALEGDEVYDDITLSATCYITDASRINELAAWLKGSGTVTFANRQGGFYYARITNQISIAKILRGNPACSFSVSFRCKPFFYITADPIELTEPGALTNPTAFTALPVIDVYGEGDTISLLVGTASIMIDDLDGHITIDCENMIAYDGMTNMSSHVTLVDDEWPVLSAGYTMVNWTAGITSVTVTPNWRTL